AEITLRRAHAASSSGHLRDALQLLALISQADPLRAEADRLRSDIQRALLSGSRSAATLGLTPGPAAPAPGSPSVVRNE
ncbi:MAG: hypothetical protein IMZ55_02110, partial [Acidobacteria bacterium]|nr:hypothetical protein [Acidobacteriota bacterium]